MSLYRYIVEQITNATLSNIVYCVFVQICDNPSKFKAGLSTNESNFTALKKRI
ncbi:hypothetical protein Loa_02353 [Legionella oakridgensis ATCC 33761 = DSM 21215]|uniref:Uncharacterized protein n=2 Tax=Legionella oakridgensis TaxID=29423 RepID=W0BDG5_9GAMM|nr:hypothetical protein Loa_02353 [Legionella oakridgensis ATCC 33761 = DSM 21215]ETO92528.1 hypothetical protein LOR_63c16140 [Legionella oakridgensis RV-2-2007]KTD38715.1 hypothetical protein Loak_1203 [Legionella oakridgensis]STY20900.1 Uncharacterised protein [Legionella longbeachae]